MNSVACSSIRVAITALSEWLCRTAPASLSSYACSKQSCQHSLSYRKGLPMSRLQLCSGTIAGPCKSSTHRQKEWRAFKDEHNFAGNVMVTFDDFHNKLHEDSQDLNPWTYGIFTYIERISGSPIPPPDVALGHGLFFPAQNCRIDFTHANGILEVLWQTTEFEHQTTAPPPTL